MFIHESITKPSISVLGLVSWDEVHVVSRMPVEGGWSPILESLSAPGGTSGNIAATINALGGHVSLFAKVGSDERSGQIIDCLEKQGIDRSHCVIRDGPTDLSIVLVSRESGERTILWNEQPGIARGDRIDIDTLFRAEMTVIDCADMPLRRFLTDLPAHTYPGARVLGTLTYLANSDAVDKMEIALRHDVLVGNEREYQQLTGVDSSDLALFNLQRHLPGANLRLAVMTCGSRGAMAVTRDEHFLSEAVPVTAIDTTGAGDSFVGAVAFAQSLRWDIPRSLRFSNAVASETATVIGAQANLPDLDRALAIAGEIA